ncbi:ATP synthase F0 subunit B [Desulfosarcina sp. OttesenSCG-928-G10]|nr:ATP synthase F0 subunit B [Desulfosarcina sp. OttesenSCG-928-G10]
MEIIEATALISINETFFVLLISFLIFLYLMNRIMIRPLMAVQTKRNGYLDTLRLEIDTARSDMDALNADIDAERAKLLHEAHARVVRLEEEADHDVSGIMASARTEISDIRHETEIAVNRQIAEVRSRLATEVETLTTLIMEKVLHRRLQ